MKTITIRCAKPEGTWPMGCGYYEYTTIESCSAFAKETLRRLVRDCTRRGEKVIATTIRNQK